MNKYYGKVTESKRGYGMSMYHIKKFWEEYRE